MKMMERLLRNVGRSWDRIPKEVPVLFVRRSTGVHPFMTVDGNQLHLHTLPYQPGIPVKQSIVLEDLTLEELADTLQQMGYEAHVTDEAVKNKVEARKSHTLIDAKNVPIMDGGRLETFTSKLWEKLYPIARLLQETDNDIDRALEQMYLTTTRGSWLEYWASFFGLRRSIGENDDTLRRRIFLTFMNIKTNDVAIEELINYSVHGKVKIEDYIPAKFLIYTTPEYMDEAGIIRSIVDSIKGAGIDYLLYYRTTEDEHYKSYLQDKTGVPFQQNDRLGGGLETGFEEVRYGLEPIDMGRAFRLNKDMVLSSKVISPWHVSKLKDTVTFQVSSSEVFPVKRKQRKEDEVYFRTNSGKIGDPLHVLFGTEDYGDNLLNTIIEGLSDALRAPEDVPVGYDITATSEDHYIEPVKKGAIGFKLGASLLSATAKLSKQEQRAFEGGYMRLERDGKVVRELAL